MKRYIVAGERVTVTLPWSEVCLSMRVADKAMGVEITPTGAAQLFGDDGAPFSFPITLGEAGIYSDAGGHFITA